MSTDESEPDAVGRATTMITNSLEKGEQLKINEVRAIYKGGGVWALYDDGEVFDVVIAERWRSALKLVHHIESALEKSRKNELDSDLSLPAGRDFQ